MAVALLARRAGHQVTVRSAGSEPADRLHPAVVEARREVGIDLVAERPTWATTELASEAGVVVTMGGGDTGRATPAKRHLDWEIKGPEGLGLDGVRPIRDDIDAGGRALVEGSCLRATTRRPRVYGSPT